MGAGRGACWIWLMKPCWPLWAGAVASVGGDGVAEAAAAWGVESADGSRTRARGGLRALGVVGGCSCAVDSFPRRVSTRVHTNTRERLFEKGRLRDKRCGEHLLLSKGLLECHGSLHVLPGAQWRLEPRIHRALAVTGVWSATWRHRCDSGGTLRRGVSCDLGVVILVIAWVPTVFLAWDHLVVRVVLQ